MLELFFEMTETDFSRDEEVTTNVTFLVTVRSEIPDMTGFGIPDIDVR